MKTAEIVGCCIGGVAFLFATYVSATGGPDLSFLQSRPDQERIDRIERMQQIQQAAAAPAPEAKPAGGCCAAKQAEAVKPAGCPETGNQAKSGCSGESSAEKCSHH